MELIASNFDGFDHEPSSAVADSAVSDSAVADDDASGVTGIALFLHLLL